MSKPIPMILTCPMCSARHVDAGEFATRPHHTHACQACGMCWRPAELHTVGVQFLPGFKDGDAPKVVPAAAYERAWTERARQEVIDAAQEWGRSAASVDDVAPAAQRLIRAVRALFDS